MAWDDEDVPVILLEDGNPVRATTRTVEVRPPRRRRRELALAVAAVVVVAAVGLLGDDGGDTAAPTTPTTKRTTTTRRTTSSRVPRSTTTTSWPQYVAGTGPLLSSPSGTAVMLVDGSNRVTVVDLDTGDQCTTDPPGDGAWPAFPGSVAGEVAVLDSGGGLLTVDAACTVTDLRRFTGGWPLAATADSLWYFDEAEGDLVERSTASGELTRRSFDLSPFHPPDIIAAGERLVAGLAGEISLLDPATGSVEPLGTGMPIAATADVVAVVQCPRLACGLALVDLRSRDRRDVAGVTLVPWERAAFSPDGRKLRIWTSTGSADRPVPAIVDLATGEVTRYPGFTALTFAYRGDWLLGAEEDDLVAFREDGETIRLDSIRATESMLLLRRV